MQTYRTLVSNITARARDRPRFKPHVFPEFWQKWNFIFHKKRKSAKTHGSCKHIVHWCQILQHEPGTDLCLFKLGVSPFEPKDKNRDTPVKTQGSCKYIAHWCQILQHEPGTDLGLQIKKKVQVQIKHNQHELDRLGKLQKVLR